MGVGEWIVIGISIVLAAWFLIGSYLNNRRSQVILGWLAQGAPALGKVSAARFLASTSAGFRAMLKFESGPATQVEVVMGLRRRENLPLWLFQWLTHKPDLLTLNFTLRNAPPHESWAFQTKKASGLVEQANRSKKTPLVFLEEIATHRLYVRQKGGEAPTAKVKTYLDTHPQVKILALQTRAPNFILALPVPQPGAEASEAFFKDLNNLL